MDAGQKKIVLDDEQVEEMDTMADKVVEFADRFDELAEQTINFDTLDKILVFKERINKYEN